MSVTIKRREPKPSVDPIEEIELEGTQAGVTLRAWPPCAMKGPWVVLNHGHSVRNVVSASRDARQFANALLELCDQVEGS